MFISSYMNSFYKLHTDMTQDLYIYILLLRFCMMSIIFSILTRIYVMRYLNRLELPSDAQRIYGMLSAARGYPLILWTHPKSVLVAHVVWEKTTNGDAAPRVGCASYFRIKQKSNPTAPIELIKLDNPPPPLTAIANLWFTVWHARFVTCSM